MKRLLAAMLCLSLALFGCAKAEVPSEPTGTTEGTETTVGTAGDWVMKLPMVAVSMPITTETTTGSDGKEIFHYSHQTLSLVFPEPEIADRVIIDYLSRIDSAASSVESMRQSAAANYVSGQDFIPYLYNLTYSPTRIDQGVLSLAGYCITYSGGVHPDTTCTAANYDLTTGSVLTLGSILSHIDKKEVLQTLVLEKLAQIRDNAYLFDGYKDTVVTRFRQDESRDEDWYFTENGLCFYFSPYEIAPYASGVIVAEIPYESLVGVIADDFFPPETQRSTGTLTEIPLESADLSDYTQIAELILQKESAKTLLYTDKTVRNLKIFYPDPLTARDTVVFATQLLTAGDAVMVEAPEEIKSQLTYSYAQ